mmetsp:Transcript_81337/g.263876  ORF Transcript_81337/g.263876 Transcript_81337/m.263876 type:complete len:308 (-) Transcript_81337:4769-5692(-)
MALEAAAALQEAYLGLVRVGGFEQPNAHGRVAPSKHQTPECLPGLLLAPNEQHFAQEQVAPGLMSLDERPGLASVSHLPELQPRIPRRGCSGGHARLVHFACHPLHGVHQRRSDVQALDLHRAHPGQAAEPNPRGQAHQQGDEAFQLSHVPLEQQLDRRQPLLPQALHLDVGLAVPRCQARPVHEDQPHEQLAPREVRELRVRHQRPLCGAPRQEREPVGEATGEDRRRFALEDLAEDVPRPQSGPAGVGAGRGAGPGPEEDERVAVQLPAPTDGAQSFVQARMQAHGQAVHHLGLGQPRPAKQNLE